MNRLYATAALLLISLLISSAAEAQWVMIGRKSLGAIHNLQGEHSDVATVLLEAPAEKVYAAAVRTLESKEGVRIIGKDDGALSIDFTKGKDNASMKISRLEEKVSMIVVTGSGTVRRSGDTSVVVEGILRVCGELGVKCSLSQQ